MRAQTEITVRFADCDALGHTNNAKYFTYMEQARVALFRKVFNISDGKAIKPSHFSFILAEITCRYLAPTFTDDRITVTARVTELKNSSFVIEYEMVNAKTQEAVAAGKSVQVWYDYEGKKSVPIPEFFRNLALGDQSK